MKRVVFWGYHKNKPTKIKLIKGEDIELVEGGSTDEGWSRTYTTYYFDGTKIVCERVTESLDCDGRLNRYWTGSCLLQNLNYYQGKYPKWETEISIQRDYEAEKAGY